MMSSRGAGIPLVAAMCGIGGPVFGLGNHNLPLDRPFTLRNLSPAGLEAEYHRMSADSLPRSFLFPRPCIWAEDRSPGCAETGRIGFSDSSRARGLNLMPIAGYEFRHLGENANALAFGALASGYSGPVSIHLDARLYSETHEVASTPSYDGEAIDRQDEQASGSIAYSSYARYRSDFSYDWSWGRLTAGRDAAHWGPAQFTNLVFQQDGIPFNHLTFTADLGPIRVESLFGQLMIGSDWENSTSTDTRSLFAHRYELRLFRDLLLGMSEQLILFNQSRPFAFTPIVPLFIAKYSEKEKSNNGNIALDASWRWPGMGSVYSEFLIDDLQSPGSMFGDFWANKWAWTTGVHAIRGESGREMGVILEYARVEPWVYTHYLPNTAQTSHFDRPLGNQDGPNSQSIQTKGYLRFDEGLYLGLKGKCLWKGRSKGSSLLDTHESADGRTKVFLGDDALFAGTVSPTLAFRRGNYSAYLGATWGDVSEAVAGFQAGY